MLCANVVEARATVWVFTYTATWAGVRCFDHRDLCQLQNCFVIGKGLRGRSILLLFIATMWMLSIDQALVLCELLTLMPCTTLCLCWHSCSCFVYTQLRKALLESNVLSIWNSMPHALYVQTFASLPYIPGVVMNLYSFTDKRLSLKSVVLFSC